jgi:hypothetical protein
MIALQFISNVIPGDEKLTLEGNKFGLYMFEANHQCISTVLTTYRDGTTTEKVSESATARGRCDPYRYWFRIHTTCKRNSDVVSVKWTFDHSINGGPFLRIVDVPDACTLSYSPIFHNSWIKTEYDNPQVMGFPVENIYD